MATPDSDATSTPAQIVWDVNEANHELWRAKNGDPAKPTEYNTRPS